MTELTAKARRGVSAISDMLGPDMGRRLGDFAATDRFGAAMSRLALEFCYADTWDEDGLTRRERSLLLIAVLIALRQPDELKNHVRLGLANGVLPSDLEKILLHIVPYVGFPATSTASTAIRQLLKESGSPSEVGGEG